jgi:hypothetical protein
MPIDQPQNRLDWPNIDRLLLACQFDHKTAMTELDLSTLKALPPTQLSLLTVESARWLLYNLRNHSEITISNRDPGADRQLATGSAAESQPNFPTVVKRLTATLQEGKFDAAIVFTQPHCSPYSLVYLLYLSGIPIRVGQSSEFGGNLLSVLIHPPLDSTSPTVYHQHLLQAILA